jgi:D-inositol-3-phosphate glycosyltransferase
LSALVDELNLRDVVRFVGAVPHAELPAYYRAADAVVVCSHSESFGLAALEAHSCGTPVVGTPVGGLSHVVEDERSGFLVETRDPAVFAARLKTLLADDPLRARFGAAAIGPASSVAMGSDGRRRVRVVRPGAQQWGPDHPPPPPRSDSRVEERAKSWDDEG